MPIYETLTILHPELPETRVKEICTWMQGIVEKGQEWGCCKLTLEVIATNSRARSVYHAAGFAHASADEHEGGTLFYSRPLE